MPKSVLNFALVLLLTVVLTGWQNPLQAEELTEFQQMEQLNHRGIWDGRFTRARSGIGWELPDGGSSEGKSGVDEDPRNYYILPHEQLNRMYDEVERDEITNVGKIRDYSKEAILQFPRDMVFNGHAVPGGYYLAHLGDWYSGSKEINMGHSDEWVPIALQNQRAKGELKSYSSVILKRQGRVVAAFPINYREPYKRKKGEPKAKWPFGRLENTSDGRSRLKIYYKKWIYVVNTEASEKPILYPPVVQGIQIPGEQTRPRDLPPLN